MIALTEGSPGSASTERVLRPRELEAHIERFPDVPAEVIVKEDVLRHGVFFTPEALRGCDAYPVFLVGGRRRSYKFMSLDAVPAEIRQQGRFMQVPECLTLTGPPYGLRPTHVHVRLASESPYLVDRVDGNLVLLGDGEPVAQVAYAPVPGYRFRHFEDGTSYADVVHMYFGHQLHVPSITCLRECQYFQEGLSCRFCDFGTVAANMRRMGLTPLLTKRVEQVAEALDTILHEETGPTAPIGYCLTGGTVTGEADGLDDTGCYLRYLETIKGRVGNRWPAILMIEAKPAEDVRRFAATGPVWLQSNLEVWDRDLFEAICPGKARRVGRDEWLRRLYAAVDILGQGNVLTNLITGVELAHPDGFRDVAAAVDATARGLDELMRHGVLPTFCSYIPEPGSPLGARSWTPAPLEYFIRLDQAWYETWRKYWLPPPSAVAGPVGPGRSTFAVSAFLEVDY